MARTEARIFTDVWNDADWRGLGPAGRDTYVLLLTQVDLTHCGVIPLREGKWAPKADVPVDDICAALKRLELINWVVIDYETRELFVRSLIRRDKVLRSPKLWVPLKASIDAVDSVQIRAALLAELVRTQAEGGVNDRLQVPLIQLITGMERQLDTLSGSLSGTRPATHRDGLGDTDSRSHAHSLQGGGDRGQGQALSPIPSPTPLAPPPDSPPSDVAGAKAEGEEDRESLITEIREIRPDWARASIRRALADPRVTDRPAGLIRRAALAMAADPESAHPGRLGADGPWWKSEGVRAPPGKPPWCGECDEHTRQTGDPDQPERCKACHPSTRRDAA